MARIIGTRHADLLFGTDEADLIRAGRGEDTVYGGLGEDLIYGGRGNDVIYGGEERSEIYGGLGSDEIHFARGYAYGGRGNDNIQVSGGGHAIGGDGDDTIIGTGALWGDQGPETPAELQTAGNDILSLIADADGSWAHGGGGSDTFSALLDALNPSLAVIDDFRSGEDRIEVWAEEGHDEPTDAAGVFLTLDANHNGVLEYTDSLSGGGVYVDTPGNTMFLLYGAGALVVRGATQLTSSDWIFGPDA